MRVDRAERTVQCDDGTAEPYDTLVLATGSNPVLPPLRGLFEPGGRDLPDGVHPFRTMADCLALSAALRPGLRAVVIGGGLLGVSAARALAERTGRDGGGVVLAQQGDRLMERQLDEDASALLMDHVAALGVEVHTECRVRGLLTTPGPDRRVTGVELSNGLRLDAELVVLACGVRPRTGLAQAAGLTVRKGVVVDDELRTSDPRIHAIGDCAEHDGRVYGLAGPALEQADALAAVLTAPGAGSGTGAGTGSGTTDGTGAGAHTATATATATPAATPAPAPSPASPSSPATARWTWPPSARPPRSPATTCSASPTPPAAPTARSSSAATAWSAACCWANSPPWAPSPAPGRATNRFRIPPESAAPPAHRRRRLLT